MLSPSSIEIDREDKFEQYRAAGVMHYWIIDPSKRTIEARTLRDSRYAPAGSGVESNRVRLPPFDGLEIAIAQLFRK